MRPRYRRNRIARKFRFGPRIRDEITGFPTHELRLVLDDYGNRLDPRKTKPDRDWRDK